LYKNSYNEKKPIPQKKLIEYFINNNYKLTNGSEGIIYGIKEKEYIQIESSNLD